MLVIYGSKGYADVILVLWWCYIGLLKATEKVKVGLSIDNPTQ